MPDLDHSRIERACQEAKEWCAKVADARCEHFREVVAVNDSYGGYWDGRRHEAATIAAHIRSGAPVVPIIEGPSPLEKAEADRAALMKVAREVAKWEGEPTRALDYVLVDALAALPAALLAEVKGEE